MPLATSDMTWDHLRTLADELGLSLLGSTSADPLGSPHPEAVSRWQENDFAGQLEYLKKPPELLTDARHLLPGGLSVVFVLAPYETRDPGPTPRGFGRIARYAWGRDYHRVFKKLLSQFGAAAVAGTAIRWRAFTDAIPLLERPYAARARLGFIGKHTLLIRPGLGSFFLIGGVIFSASIADAPAESSVLSPKGSCGTCFRCASSCPTNAIISPYLLDARRCISYLTIEKRGMLTREERTHLGSWLFGCDLCQDACPHNHRAIKQPTPALRGLEAQGRSGPFLSLANILAIDTDEQFRAQFAGTPLMRAKREGLIRNALCVAVNQQYDDIGALILSRGSNDPSPIIRAHAIWAALQLGLIDQAGLETITSAEKDDSVLQELCTQ
jgi:epoxyqueuosine reductase